MSGWWITKGRNSELQSVLDVGLQSVPRWITKCGRVDYNVGQGLQSVAGYAFLEITMSSCK